MDKALNIIDGYLQLALKRIGLENGDVEQLAKERKRICIDCIEPNKEKNLTDAGRCVKCNCVMEAKWRAVNSKCIINKW